jgi:nucleoside 2-deoxyribosyltransferase
MKKIYLCGLINPNTPESLEWRNRVTEQIGHLFEIRDPVRGKDHLTTDKTCAHTEGASSSHMTHKSCIMRDFHDVKDCDILLVNLNQWESKRPLQGTLFELGWAYAWNKIVFAIGGYEHMAHPFFSETIADFFDNEEAAIEFLRKYFA